MSTVAIIETTRMLISLIGELQTLSVSQNYPQKTHDRVVLALRTIYFTSDGVIKIMEDIANGGMPDTDVIREVLPPFNDAEWKVHDELKFLESKKLQKSFNITLKDSRILREIAYGKRNLRHFIQDTLNEALTLGNDVNREDVNLAVKAVKALNTSIEKIEAVYNRRAPK